MPQALPTTPGYVPRSRSNALKEIVEDHYEELLRVYDEKFRSTYGPLHPRIKDLLEAFTRCGDPHFGFLRLRCCNADCDEKTERIVPFSCKTRIEDGPIVIKGNKKPGGGTETWAECYQ